MRTTSIPLISISGTVGAGKTSAMDYLSSRFPRALIQKEQVEPALESYHLQKNISAFELQMAFALQFLRRQFDTEYAGMPVISDRCMNELHHVFTRLRYDTQCISEFEHQLLFRVLEISEQVAKPDYVVFISVSPQTAFDRIKVRNRPAESNITLEYLQNLHERYISWFDNLRCQKCLIDGEALTLQEVGTQISAILEKTYSLDASTKKSA